MDTSAISGKGDQLNLFFQDGGQVVPLSTLLSTKNELADPKFLAGLKNDPRQNAILDMTAAAQGGRKRVPLDVVDNGDGTYTIIDGNATAQAAMLAGWSHIPMRIVSPLAAAESTTERQAGESQLSLDLFDLLTPRQQQQKLEQPSLFG